jgi:hypothetical protein
MHGFWSCDPYSIFLSRWVAGFRPARVKPENSDWVTWIRRQWVHVVVLSGGRLTQEHNGPLPIGYLNPITPHNLMHGNEAGLIAYYKPVSTRVWRNIVELQTCRVQGYTTVYYVQTDPDHCWLTGQGYIWRCTSDRHVENMERNPELVCR